MRVAHTVLYLERNVDGTIGGSYRSLLYLVKLLPKDRWRPIVAFYRDHHLVDEFHKAGCRVILLKQPQPSNLVNRARRVSRFPPARALLLAAQRVVNFTRGSVGLFLSHVALLVRERVQLVHLNNGVMSGTELLAASRVLGVKTVVHQRGIGTLPKSFGYVRRLIDHVICVSDAARTNLVAHGLPSDRCTTVHNGIDPNEFRASITRDPLAVRRSLGIPDDALVVGNAGMIRGWKGQLVLVEAVAQLRAAHPRLRCLIVGGTSDKHDGDTGYMRRILDYIADHDLMGCVQILGYQQIIAEFIQVFDIMVHTAIEPEPFSRSVLEGMTLGRAMIGTRTGGTPEAIEDGVTGILVPPNDPGQLAEKIDQLVRDPYLRERLGVQAQERIRERFSIRTNVASTQEIYEEVFGKGVRAGQ